MGYDDIDRRLLAVLQRDADRSIDDLGNEIGLSRNATWRRIKRLEDEGYIRGRVVLVDPVRLGLGLTLFITIRTSRHDAAWAKSFRQAISGFPEIVGAFRTSGDQDYLVQARVADVPAYDRLYQRLISKIDLSDVSASFVMEELKATTEIPIP